MHRQLVVGFSPILQKLGMVVGCGFQTTPGKISLLVEATSLAGAIMYPLGHKVRGRVRVRVRAKVRMKVRVRATRCGLGWCG